jgi:MFS family permease
LYSIPYLISAVSTPFIGLIIDKVGRRTIFIILSTILLIIAFILSMVVPECDQCYNEVYPLVITGIGYSIYASAMWGSIPYTVSSSTVGSAFGICTAIQNIGLVISPLVVGFLTKKTSKNFGYFYMCVFFLILCGFGLFFNIALYINDIKYHDGILNKVEKEDNIRSLISDPDPSLSRQDIIKKSLAKSRTA